MGQITMNVTMKVSGLAELKKALEQFPVELARKPARQAVKAAAQLVQAEAKRLAEPHRQTGALEKDIVIMGSRKSVPGVIDYAVGVRRGKAKKYANTSKNRRLHRVGKKYYPEGPSFYWRFLEFGSRHQKRTPFLVPAFEGKKMAALNTIKTRLALEINRLAQRLRIRS